MKLSKKAEETLETLWVSMEEKKQNSVNFKTLNIRDNNDLALKELLEYKFINVNDGKDESICILLGHPKSCPHGKTIPPGKCCEKKRKGMHIIAPLSELSIGQL